MKKTVLSILLILQALFSIAQTKAIRDSLIGNYFCNVILVLNGNSYNYNYNLNAYPDVNDSLSFFIDDTIACCWHPNFLIFNDTSFINIPGGLDYGFYWLPDSLWIFRNCLSPTGCFYYYSCNKIISTNIEVELYNFDFVSVFPNPAKDRLYISTLSFCKNFKLEFFNILGEKILDKNIHNLNSSMELDVSQIKNGIYFLLLDQGEKKKFFKIIIQH